MCLGRHEDCRASGTMHTNYRESDHPSSHCPGPIQLSKMKQVHTDTWQSLPIKVRYDFDIYLREQPFVDF